MGTLVGITCSYNSKDGRFFLPEAYAKAVLTAGGIPVILPGVSKFRNISTYFKIIKGIVLAGGGDVDPSFYNEEPDSDLGEVTPDRDLFEIRLVKAALRRDIPILGICRGIQVLNVACGGTLIQHIPSKNFLKHFQSAPRWYATHKIAIEEKSHLFNIFRTRTLRVNSFHHQAIKDPAACLKVTARSSDGIIEAVEKPNSRFVLGVQWHPECMTEKDKMSGKLFRAFIEACVSAK